MMHLMRCMSNCLCARESLPLVQRLVYRIGIQYDVARQEWHSVGKGLGCHEITADSEDAGHELHVTESACCAGDSYTGCSLADVS